jgi:aryl-alcohol dehydrogenase
MKITAAVTQSVKGRFCVEEIDIDSPRDDEVLVRIVAVGLCHSDLLAADGVLPAVLPAVLGHEGSGVVEAVGPDVTKLKKGDKVVMTFNFCGQCATCTQGEPCYCDNFLPLNYAPVRADGSHTLCGCNGGPGISGGFFGQSSFASYALGNQRNVVKVVDDVDLTLLGPLGCGVQTGAGSVMRSLKAVAGSSIIIFGGGSVGLSAVMGAVIQGCSMIILVEPMAARRALGLELGATHALDPREGDVVANIREILPSGANYAVDTSGAIPAIESGLQALGMRGTLALVGVPSNLEAAVSLNILATLSSALTIKAVIEGDSEPHAFIPQLVELYGQGKLPLDKITTKYPFAEINEAVEDQKNGKCVKAVLVF